MAVKVDLEKAYDWIRWDFLSDTLLDAELSHSLIKAIMACVTSVSMQLLWNGAISKSFIPTRGFRQGDPLSPYLFILHMEKLGHLIDVAVEQNDWEPLMLSRRGLGLSHLFFADDLLLFCRANDSGADCLKKVLNTFCYFASHRVNKLKTHVFFSSNVKNEEAMGICSKLGFTRTTDLGIYLGAQALFGKRIDFS